MKHPVEYHYSVAEIVHLFGFTTNYVLHCIHSGKLKAIKFDKPKSYKGFCYRIPGSALETWLKSVK